MTTSAPGPIRAASARQSALDRGAAPSGEGRSGGRLTTAAVLSITRHGALIEAGPNRWLMNGAPPLPPGATLSLEPSAAGRREQSSRLLAIRSGIGAERVASRPSRSICSRLRPAGQRQRTRPGPLSASRSRRACSGRPAAPSVQRLWSGCPQSASRRPGRRSSRSSSVASAAASWTYSAGPQGSIWWCAPRRRSRPHCRTTSASSCRRRARCRIDRQSRISRCRAARPARAAPRHGAPDRRLNGAGGRPGEAATFGARRPPCASGS